MPTSGNSDAVTSAPGVRSGPPPPEMTYRDSSYAPIIRQAGRIDWAYVRAHLEPLAEVKEESEILSELERRRTNLER